MEAADGMVKRNDANRTLSEKQPLITGNDGYGRKQLHSTYAFLSHLSLGMLVALGGPTFLDLLLIVNVGIDRGTILFTGWMIGYVCGGVIGGVAYEKFNEALTLFYFVLGTGLLTVLIPWCTYLWLMAIVRVIQGVTMGAVDTGGNALIMATWGDEGAVYIQAMHLAYGVGGVISPIVAEPFLALKTWHNKCSIVIVNNNLTDDSSPVSDYINTTELVEIHASKVNRSIFMPSNQTTKVYIPFLLLGIVTIATALPYLEMFLRSHKTHVMADKKRTRTDMEPRHIPLTKTRKTALLILISLFFMSYNAVENSFANFIMTFVVKHLHWSKTKGTRITTVFWVSFCVGRSVAVPAVKFIKPWKMLMVDIVLLDFAFLAFYLGAGRSEALTWVSTTVIAIALASIFPTGNIWIEKRIMEVTARLVSLFVVSAIAGAMISSILIGYLFERYTPMWFVYLLCMEAIFCTIAFVAINVIVLQLLRQRETKSEGAIREQKAVEPTNTGEP